jgi:glycosyltransferase involved in cell wall biosynthesis
VVIASRAPAIVEVAAQGAILLDVRDRALWMETLRLAVKQPETMRGLRDRAQARAGEFSWTRTARLTKAVYEHAIQRFRK